MELKIKHHGELIKNFISLNRIPQKEFCKALNISASNFDATLMKEKISPKHQIRIKEIYGIDLDNYNDSDVIPYPLVVREKLTQYESEGDKPTCKDLLAERERVILSKEAEISTLKEFITHLLKNQK